MFWIRGLFILFVFTLARAQNFLDHFPVLKFRRIQELKISNKVLHKHNHPPLGIMPILWATLAHANRKLDKIEI